MNQYKPGDYNKGGMIAFSFSMLFSLGFLIYISLIHEGIDLGELSTIEEISTEVEAAPSAQALDPSTVTEPWLASDELAAYGQGLYSMQCAMCHGPSGQGDGVAAGGLVPPPRNLVEGDWKRGGTSIELFTTLTEGFGAGSSMASFAHLAAVDRWALVHYIRQISENTPVDDPEALETFGRASIE